MYGQVCCSHGSPSVFFVSASCEAGCWVGEAAALDCCAEAGGGGGATGADCGSFAAASSGPAERVGLADGAEVSTGAAPVVEETAGSGPASNEPNGIRAIKSAHSSTPRTPEMILSEKPLRGCWTSMSGLLTNPVGFPQAPASGKRLDSAQSSCAWRSLFRSATLPRRGAH